MRLLVAACVALALVYPGCAPQEPKNKSRGGRAPSRSNALKTSGSSSKNSSRGPRQNNINIDGSEQLTKTHVTTDEKPEPKVDAGNEVAIQIDDKDSEQLRKAAAKLMKVVANELDVVDEIELHEDENDRGALAQDLLNIPANKYGRRASDNEFEILVKMSIAKGHDRFAYLIISVEDDVSDSSESVSEGSDDATNPDTFAYNAMPDGFAFTPNALNGLVGQVIHGAKMSEILVVVGILRTDSNDLVTSPTIVWRKPADAGELEKANKHQIDNVAISANAVEPRQSPPTVEKVSRGLKRNTYKVRTFPHDDLTITELVLRRTSHDIGDIVSHLILAKKTDSNAGQGATFEPLPKLTWKMKNAPAFKPATQVPQGFEGDGLMDQFDLISFSPIEGLVTGLVIRASMHAGKVHKMSSTLTLSLTSYRLTEKVVTVFDKVMKRGDLSIGDTHGFAAEPLQDTTSNYVRRQDKEGYSISELYVRVPGENVLTYMYHIIVALPNSGAGAAAPPGVFNYAFNGAGALTQVALMDPPSDLANADAGTLLALMDGLTVGSVLAARVTLAQLGDNHVAVFSRTVTFKPKDPEPAALDADLEAPATVPGNAPPSHQQ